MQRSSSASGSGEAPDYNYLAPDNAEIQVKSNLRDLGVEISSDFTCAYLQIRPRSFNSMFPVTPLPSPDKQI